MVLIPGSVVHLDDFRQRQHGYVYFLSHTHRDHHVGLHEGWDWGEIYCSPETRKIMTVRFPKLAAKFHELPVGDPDGTSIYIGASKCVEIKVWLLDARHCPGSVMFVLDGYFGRVCYTGDFRLEKHIMKDPSFRTKYAPLFDEDLDFLYVDNTHQGLQELPTRQFLEQLLQKAVALYPSDTEFHFGAEFGKEEMVVRIAADVLNSKVVVNPETLAEYKAIGREDLVKHMVCSTSSSSHDARVHLVLRTKVNELHLRELNMVRRKGRVVGVLLQGACINGRRSVQKHALQNGLPRTLYEEGHLKLLEWNSKTRKESMPTFLLVPYSLHISISELQYFVEIVRHAEIIGFPKDMDQFRVPIDQYANGLSESRKTFLENECEAAAPLLRRRTIDAAELAAERKKDILVQALQTTKRFVEPKLRRSNSAPRFRDNLERERDARRVGLALLKFEDDKPPEPPRLPSLEESKKNGPPSSAAVGGMPEVLIVKEEPLEVSMNEPFLSRSTESFVEVGSETEDINQQGDLLRQVAVAMEFGVDILSKKRKKKRKSGKKRKRSSKRLTEGEKDNDEKWNTVQDSIAMTIGKMRGKCDLYHYESLLQLAMSFGKSERECLRHYKNKMRRFSMSCEHENLDICTDKNTITKPGLGCSDGERADCRKEDLLKNEEKSEKANQLTDLLPKQKRQHPTQRRGGRNKPRFEQNICSD